MTARPEGIAPLRGPKDDELIERPRFHVEGQTSTVGPRWQIWDCGRAFARYRDFASQGTAVAICALLNEGDRAASRIAELKAEREWQPIETAPKDGEGIIAWGPPFQRAGEMFWDREIERWVLPGLIPPPRNQPTHWQKLPDPPALSNPPSGEVS